MAVSSTTHPEQKTFQTQWLAVYFPTLAVEIFTDPKATDDGCTVILAHQRVHMLNQAATQAGIIPGCSLATAHSIAPDLTHHERDEAKESLRLQMLAQCFYRYSSMVSIESPDCVLVEVQGSLRLWQGWQNIIRGVAQICCDLGHRQVSRLAKTPEAALALARGGVERLEDAPLHSLNLPLRGISERMLERLANMGIYRLGQLQQLPTKGLGKRFGQALTRYLGRLSGILPDPRLSIQPQEQFDERLNLLKPITNKAVLEAGPMSQLAAQLQHWLIARQLRCTTLNWHLNPFKGEGVVMTVRFAGGQQRQENMMRITSLRLQQQAAPPEVLTVRLQALSVQPLIATNQDLFGSVEQAAEEVAELVDELHARLGPQSCRSIGSTAQHAPDRAWRSYPPLGSAESAPTSPKWTSSKWTGAGREASTPYCYGQRPIWLFARPYPVRRQQLTLLQGPERIQRGPLTYRSRDYYIAKHAQGPLCWVFHEHVPDLEQTSAKETQWYLHGYFA